MSTGQKHNTQAAKLTPHEVLEIRDRYSQGWTQAALCKEYRVGINQIGRIVRGESWQHVAAAMPTALDSKKMFERLSRRLAADGIEIPTESGGALNPAPVVEEQPWFGPPPTQEEIERLRSFGVHESTLARMEKALADRRELTDVSGLEGEGEVKAPVPDAGY